MQQQKQIRVSAIPGAKLEEMSPEDIPVEKRSFYVTTVVGPMIKFLAKNKLPGLASTQVGVALRMFIMKFSVRVDRVAVVFSPSYKPGFGAKKKDVVEACINYPGRTFQKKRYNRIVATYENIKGEVVIQKLSNHDAFHFQQYTDYVS